MKPATDRSHRIRRGLVTGFAFTVAAGSMFTGTAAQAAGGLGGGLVDGNTGDRPSHLGEKCSVPSAATADKVITVKGTGGADATVTTCQEWDGDYYSALSTDGHVGYNGIAAPGEKREGDGMTPSGLFGMGYGFGVESEPEQFGGSNYAQVTEDDVWVDGDAVENYNTMQKKSEGYSGESMYQTPAYNYGQVIDYNEAGTPGMGSAIFLHVNTGSGKTAGCVSVSQQDLLKILDWEADSEVEMVITG